MVNPLLLGRDALLNSVDPSAVPQSSLGRPAVTEHRPHPSLGVQWGSFEDRWDAAKRMPLIGEPAIADLIALLQDRTLPWDTRWFAARSLGHFDTPAVVTALVETLPTAEDDLQAAIIEALSHIGPNAIPTLNTLLFQPAYQSIAVEALTRMAHSATRAPLMTALGMTQGTTKAKVIESLGQLADLDLLPVLIQALDDQASAVRLAAIHGLILLKKQVDEVQWVSWLQRRVEDSDPAVAQRAIQALGRATHRSATQALQAILATPSTPKTLKQSTVQALAWQNTPTALAVLVQTWDTLALDLRITALHALSCAMGTPLQEVLGHQVQRWLNALSPTPDHSLLRRNLIMLLRYMGQEAVTETLHRLRHDADAGVRLHAEAALRSRS